MSRPPSATGHRAPSAADSSRLPRALHPIAWWVWAIALATAASRTSNPLLLLLIFAVLGLVVMMRRSAAPWARGYRFYLLMALTVIAIRVVFRVVFESGVTPGDFILFRLPQIPMPSWFAGIQVGGPVSLQAVLSAALDGMRLACLLCCIGAANTLANPKRALRVLPGALYELGVAVTVALSVAPQLVESIQRVRRARRLRGAVGRGLTSVRAIAIPVLHDALDRSLQLAAGMDSRGYGRTGTASRASRRLTAGLLLAGLAALCIGAYGLLGSTVPAAASVTGFTAGAVLCVAGLALGGTAGLTQPLPARCVALAGMGRRRLRCGERRRAVPEDGIQPSRPESGAVSAALAAAAAAASGCDPAGGTSRVPRAAPARGQAGG